MKKLGYDTIMCLRIGTSLGWAPQIYTRTDTTKPFNLSENSANDLSGLGTDYAYS